MEQLTLSAQGAAIHSRVARRLCLTVFIGLSAATSTAALCVPMQGHENALNSNTLNPLSLSQAPHSGHGVTSSSVKVEQVKVEPLNWWVGMENPQLELMITGEGVAHSTLRLENALGAKLLEIIPGDSPNYLFVKLDLSTASTGILTLVLSRPASTINPATDLTIPYELKARAPGSKERQGYGNRDVMYLITPDRFANGDKANDNLPGFDDKPSNPVYSEPGNSRDNARHGGDLAGIEHRLDYLNDLGVTQLWLNPLLENRQPAYSYHGYAITDFYQIDARFGSNAQYQALVRKAADRGLGVIMDVVLNHMGSGHPWMQDLPFNDWVNPRSMHTSHRRTAVQDPYAAPKDAAAFTDGWFVDSMPDLNQRNPHLATYLIQNNLWWIEYAGLSGLRIDTWSYSDKHFLKAFSEAIMAEYPHFNMVGEEWSGNPAVVSYWQRAKQNPDGYQTSLPGLMDFPLYEVLLQAVNEEERWGTGLIRLYEALANDMLYPHAQNLVLFEGNHDTNRLYSLLGRDMNKFKLALAYVLLSNRVPQIFYGTEFAMQSPVEGRNDGAVRADMPGFGKAGFSKSDIDAMAGDSKTAFEFIRALLHFRKTSDAVHRGKLVHFVPQSGLYVQLRQAPDDNPDAKNLMVIFNKNKDSVSLDMGHFTDFLPLNTDVKSVLDNRHFSLPATLTVSSPVTLLEF
ncbi:glycoside hydrolase family 13 protein [Shewanella amazonensis]|uniref:Alpha amylase, catalytic region n=1 Tax=Shewanella amazonensis (strain ATCC BAA-1098 / SB2B) TaxID=326297 RepID=A1S660_SHEAM|nr:glycoside hydrolase family 13 protein [Shewanella amazonensis]ABL99866.1 alpha amylase, catalytic region [Shewanella amazonensis SB2B]